ncbi:MAG: hypothetical protein WBA23_17970 [Tunicatimonas sp.]|uniref:hypothetical protein n=1 Tax=Tunicatimonas sp. TaxID=1940096 RepID=UPI003C7489E9
MKKQSINNHLKGAQAMIRNAKGNPAILQKLTEWGYSAQKIDEAATLLANTQLAQQSKKQDYSTKKDVDRQWRTDWTAFQQQYREHRAVAKTLYRNDAATLERLRLNRSVPNRITDILDQAEDFYQVIAGNKDMAKLGIKADELTQAKAMVDTLVSLRERRLQCKGAAESTTQKRNEALAELRVWQQEFSRVAKMALKDDPQLLEVLGIIVPA